MTADRKRTQKEPPRRFLFWLRYQGRDVRLLPGETLIGRSVGCQILLDDALVSRRHARVVTNEERADIEDLGSVNGVFVNGERIGSPMRLSPGDRVVIGSQHLLFGAAARGADSLHATLAGEKAPPPPERRSMTRDDLSVGDLTEAVAESQRHAPAGHDLAAAQMDSESDATSRGDALELLGGVAEKVMALGRGQEAEKILSSYLANYLALAKATRTGPSAGAERAAMMAVRLADATGKPAWVDYAVDLYAALRHPLPTEVVERLYVVLRKVKGIDLKLLRAYIAILQGRQNDFSPAERFVIHRIEGTGTTSATLIPCGRATNPQPRRSPPVAPGRPRRRAGL